MPAWPRNRPATPSGPPRTRQNKRPRKSRPGKHGRPNGDQAKQDRAIAREPYEDVTKAELSDELTKQGLPKAGKVSDLIDRLAEADSSS